MDRRSAKNLSNARAGLWRLNEWACRVLDYTGAILGLLIAAPLLGFCALWIRLVDGGPVFYRQWRVGQDGWLFPMLKLRTMVLGAEPIDRPCFAQSNDWRILPGCRWMRKSHVDELPQLCHVLRGQMSLVGPRPERPEIFEQICQALPAFSRRLAGRPGLTGLAQLRNGYTNDLIGARRKLAYDLCYLRRRSVVRDLALIVQTVPRLWDRGAH